MSTPHLRPTRPEDLQPRPLAQAEPAAVQPPAPPLSDLPEPEPFLFSAPEEEPDDEDADWPDAMDDALMPVPACVPLFDTPVEKRRFPWHAVGLALLAVGAAAYAAWYCKLL